MGATVCGEYFEGVVQGSSAAVDGVCGKYFLIHGGAGLRAILLRRRDEEDHQAPTITPRPTVASAPYYER
jgi:hypothetical protein